MAWCEYVLAFGAFFLTHSLPLRPPLRSILVAWLGRPGFGAAYSALSLAVLAWLIGATGRAPYVPIWNWAPWQNHVVLAVMLPVCLILTLSITRPNPFSFGGVRNERFDPDRPGIVRLTRHPLLLALTLWAAAHVIPNGDLAHVILFGTFTTFAVLGGRLIDRRKRHEMGAEWHRMRAAIDSAPLLSPPASWRGAGIRLVLAFGLYGALLGMHPVFFGVSPLFD